MRYYNVQEKKYVTADETLLVDHRDFSVLLTHPHTGVLLPEQFLSHVRIEEQYAALDHEFYLDRVYPRLGTSVIPSINRYAVNLARPRHQDHAPRDVLGRDVLRSPVPSGVFADVLEHHYDPFHTTIEHLIERMKILYGFALIIDCHSMNSVGLPLFPDAGKQRAEFVVGTLDGTSCAPPICTAFVEALNDNDAGWQVKQNDPYKGGYITQHYACVREHVHVIQLELQRKLFMTECLTPDTPPADAFAFHEQRAHHVQRHLEKAIRAAVACAVTLYPR